MQLIEIQCPHCTNAAALPQEAVGQYVRCGACGKDFIAEPQQPAYQNSRPAPIVNPPVVRAKLDAARKPSASQRHTLRDARPGAREPAYNPRRDRGRSGQRLDSTWLILGAVAVGGLLIFGAMSLGGGGPVGRAESTGKETSSTEPARRATEGDAVPATSSAELARRAREYQQKGDGKNAARYYVEASQAAERERDSHHAEEYSLKAEAIRHSATLQSIGGRQPLPPPTSGNVEPLAVPAELRADADGGRSFRAALEKKLENFDVDPKYARLGEFVTTVADATGKNHVLTLAKIQHHEFGYMVRLLLPAKEKFSPRTMLAFRVCFRSSSIPPREVRVLWDCARTDEPRSLHTWSFKNPDFQSGWQSISLSLDAPSSRVRSTESPDSLQYISVFAGRPDENVSIYIGDFEIVEPASRGAPSALAEQEALKLAGVHSPPQSSPEERAYCQAMEKYKATEAFADRARLLNAFCDAFPNGKHVREAYGLRCKNYAMAILSSAWIESFEHFSKASPLLLSKEEARMSRFTTLKEVEAERAKGVSTEDDAYLKFLEAMVCVASDDTRARGMKAIEDARKRYGVLAQQYSRQLMPEMMQTAMYNDYQLQVLNMYWTFYGQAMRKDYSAADPNLLKSQAALVAAMLKGVRSMEDSPDWDRISGPLVRTLETLIKGCEMARKAALMSPDAAQPKVRETTQ